MAGGEVLGLDPATRTGVAFGVPGSTPELWTEFFGGEGAACEDVYERATFWLADFLKTRSPALFVIEAPVPPSAIKGFTNHDTTMITIGLYGIMVGIARCKRIPCRAVKISTWRKHFLGAGNGNLKTEQAKRAALRQCRLLGWTPPDHNAAEAGGIWDWGGAQLRQPALLGEGLKW